MLCVYYMMSDSVSVHNYVYTLPSLSHGQSCIGLRTLCSFFCLLFYSALPRFVPGYSLLFPMLFPVIPNVIPHYSQCYSPLFPVISQCCCSLLFPKLFPVIFNGVSSYANISIITHARTHTHNHIIHKIIIQCGYTATLKLFQHNFPLHPLACHQMY